MSFATRTHFAFYRSLINGLDAEASWNRYLSQTHGMYDGRSSPKKIRELRNTLIAAASRTQGQVAANCLMRLASKMSSKEVETLHFDPDFYSEAEIIALEKKRLSQTDIAKRRANLIDRQLAILNVLENEFYQPSTLSDELSHWFAPHLVARLALMKIITINDLYQVLKLGHYWYHHIPAIGKTKAKLINAWFMEHAEALGVRLNQQLIIAPTESIQLTPLQSSTLIVPLEQFKPPKHLTGESGQNRGTNCNRLKASNDYEAIHEFLTIRGKNAHTFRAYRKEAERLLLWVILERGIALSDMQAHDCEAYVKFLAAPYSLKAIDWIGKKNAVRRNPAWRPFEGKLSARSIQTAVSILTAMFSWLTSQHYLDSNPWTAIIQPKAHDENTPIEQLWLQQDASKRSLTPFLWQQVMQHLALLAPYPNEANARLRLIILFLYATGLRLSELTSLNIASLKAFQLKTTGGMGYEVLVRGKGNKVRIVPVPTLAIDALKNYLAYRPIDLETALTDATQATTPILTTLSQDKMVQQHRHQRLTPRAVSHVLKSFFKEIAQVLVRQGYETEAKQLQQASAHWLRHTHGTFACDAGIPIHITQQNLGHADSATTSIYVTTEREVRYLAVNKVFGLSG